ncbi:MAG: putative ABC transporter permease [Clostridia bacterium]|nr:putative ABC transporter permease [Clostridia bacterium]
MILIIGHLKGNMIALFLVSLIVLTFWEYIVGVLLEKIFKTKYWDYSDHKINFQGRICLTNSLAWGFLGVGFIEYIHPFIVSQLEKVDPELFHVIIYIALGIIVLDTIISIIKIVNIKSALEKIEKINEEIRKKIKDLKERGKKKTEEIETTTENVKMKNDEISVEKLESRRNRMSERLYRYVYRLKQAFPAINTKEITEILNKRKQNKENDSEDKGRK